MNYLALQGEVSDFSLKNLSLDRKLSILRGFIPRNLCDGKKIALKLPRRKAGSWVLHPRFPINSGKILYHGTRKGLKRYPFLPEAKKIQA
jgi:hypothetical protein